MKYRQRRYRLGAISNLNLDHCHPIIQQTVKEAINISPMDFAVACGWRGKLDQDFAFAEGFSTKRFPESLHNHLADEQDLLEGFAQKIGQPLSLAVDLVPFLEARKRWDLPKELRWLNGFVMAVGLPIALARGFYFRTGVDWDLDGNQTEHHFIDAPHLELRRLT